MPLSHYLLNKKERNANVQRILNSLNPDQHNFNTMMLGFTDIMQSTFFNHQRSLCTTDKEIDEMNARLEAGITRIREELNLNSMTPSEDVIILTTVLLEVINSTMLRQEELGLKVNHNAVRPKPKPQDNG